MIIIKILVLIIDKYYFFIKKKNEHFIFIKFYNRLA